MSDPVHSNHPDPIVVPGFTRDEVLGLIYDAGLTQLAASGSVTTLGDGFTHMFYFARMVAERAVARYAAAHSTVKETRS